MRNKALLYLLITFFIGASVLPQNVNCAVFERCDSSSGTGGTLLESWMEHVHENTSSESSSRAGFAENSVQTINASCETGNSCCIFDSSIDNNRLYTSNSFTAKIKFNSVSLINFRSFEKPGFKSYNKLRINIFAARQIYLKINRLLC